MKQYGSPEGHIAAIIERAAGALRDKYLRGQEEHGGQLWRKPCLGRAYEEVLDLMIYLDVVQEHIQAIVEIAESGLAGRASPMDALRDILSILKGDESTL